MRKVSVWLDLDWKFVTLGLHLEEVRKGGPFWICWLCLDWEMRCWLIVLLQRRHTLELDNTCFTSVGANWVVTWWVTSAKVAKLQIANCNVVVFYNLVQTLLMLVLNRKLTNWVDHFFFERNAVVISPNPRPM